MLLRFYMQFSRIFFSLNFFCFKCYNNRQTKSNNYGEIGDKRYIFNIKKLNNLTSHVHLTYFSKYLVIGNLR